MAGKKSTATPVPVLSAVTASQAMSHPALFGPWLGAPSFAAVRTMVRAAFAEPPIEGDLTKYQELSGRTDWPTAPADELWTITGRRSGKTLTAAALSTYLAAFRSYDKVLAPGETGTVVLAARDKAQARTLLKYVKAMLAIPLLRGSVINETAESIEIRNGSRVVNIEIMYGHFATVRGYSVVGAVLDEFAYWPGSDSANPDQETLAAIRPAMATVPGALLSVISSPYVRDGALYQTYMEHFGHDGDRVLVVNGPSIALNPTLNPRLIERDYARDPQRAASEWGGSFRDDVSAWLSSEIIESCVNRERPIELAPLRGVEYRGTWDGALGGKDESALCVSHLDKATNRVVIDMIRSWPGSVSRSRVHREAADLIRRYQSAPILHGDRVGGDLVVELFGSLGVRYAATGKLTKSESYLIAGDALREGAVELPDDVKTLRQFKALTLRWHDSGRASVDDARGNPEDRANVVALGIALTERKKARQARAEVFDQEDYRPDDARMPDADPDADTVIAWGRENGLVPTEMEEFEPHHLEHLRREKASAEFLSDSWQARMERAGMV